jgi:hypothetical protein
MDLFTNHQLEELLADRVGPCAAVYLPTTRGGGKEGPVRWKRLLRRVQDHLVAAGMPIPVARKFVKPMRELATNADFWHHQSDGCACFLGNDFFRVYRLPTKFDEIVVVGRHFHVAPLLPFVQDDGRFYVLALSRNSVRLLQGTHHAISEIDLAGVPRDLATALLTHDTDRTLTYHTAALGGGRSWSAIFHGHGVGIDDRKDDLLLYFRRIDRGLHSVLRNEHAPLVVACVEYLLPIYRKANTYPHLCATGIAGNPDDYSSRELHDRAWTLVRDRFEEKHRLALAQYARCAANGRTAAGIDEILPAAYRGDIDTLLVETNKPIWGHFVPATGSIDVHDRADAGDEDLVNMAALYTLRHGGKVFVNEHGSGADGLPLTAITRVTSLDRETVAVMADG